MKVLEKGRPQKSWAKEFVCTGNRGDGCGAKLLVEQDDVYNVYYHHHNDDYNVYNTFRCPECGVQTDIGRVPFTPRSQLHLPFGIWNLGKM